MLSIEVVYHERNGMRIGLLDHMGYGNLGDAAIQEAVIANIRKRLPNAQIVGFSLVPDDTRKRHGIPCHPVRRSYPVGKEIGNQPADRASFIAKLKSILRHNPLIYTWAKPVSDFMRELVFCVRSYRILKNLDLLIISGGGQLCELWYGPWSHPYTIFKFSLLAKLARKKVYLLNVGAGPLKHPLSRFFSKWAVRIADYRSFRDQGSQELIRSLGVQEDLYVHPDPAYALQVGNHRNCASTGASKPIIVGLNPIGFCDPRIWPRKDNSIYKDYLEKIMRFSTWLLEQGYHLRVFTTETSVDQYALEDLRAGLLSRLTSPELLGQIFRSPSENLNDLLQEMSGFDFIVTSKFHGIIFSHLLGKPVISLSYQQKMDIAMRAVGQGDFSADIESFDVDWLIAAFRSLVVESRRIKVGFATAVEANAAILSRQFDSLFLPDKPQLS
jgi:polysaccharide pyruvyl transferase WcaK-like protein